MISHEASVKRFPSGGWGWYWVGDPDRGFSWQSQPGGWIYTILPFIEQTNLFADGLGRNPRPRNWPPAAQRISARRWRCASVPVGGRRWPIPSRLAQHCVWGDDADTYARCDYCANAGDQVQPWDMKGPPDLATGDSWTATNAWMPPNTGVNLPPFPPASATLRSQITAAHVTDGLSNTYLVGEKYLNADDYYQRPGQRRQREHVCRLRQ